MKANLPKKLKIGGHEIKVTQMKLEGDNGQFDYEDYTISIATDLAESQKESTFWHEVFHVMNTSVGEGYGHALIDSFAEQIYQVLKDNADIKWKR